MFVFFFFSRINLGQNQIMVSPSPCPPLHLVGTQPKLKWTKWFLSFSPFLNQILGTTHILQGS